MRRERSHSLSVSVPVLRLEVNPDALRPARLETMRKQIGML
jgi:hypothetical protein